MNEDEAQPVPDPGPVAYIEDSDPPELPDDHGESTEPTDSTVLDDVLITAFKQAWHEADAEGDHGNRVRRGLAAVLEILG